jgi:Ca-activated chloride channel family protein
MRKLGILFVGLFSVGFGTLGSFGCAKSGPLPQAPTGLGAGGGPGAGAGALTDEQLAATDGAAAAGTTSGHANGDGRTGKRSDTWIGAAAEGDLLSSSTRDTFLGVWVDVPEVRAEVRPPMEVVLVVDTSGSMAGSKIESARAAATTLVRSLKDGDMVALDAFSVDARTLVAPTRLDMHTRTEILRQIAQLVPAGSTNMFSGLSMAESQMAAAPASHSLRRIVMISDGIANIGPSSPDVLGSLAQNGLRFRAQVTSFGVGNDYDERTLNALSVRSSGRLYHIGEPREMSGILRNELALLDATLASDASLEIVAAPGVQVLGADGIRAEFRDGGLRIPLGALHGGQHREALVRVRIVDPAAFEGHSRSLASVRLRFRDSTEGDLERIQEVVARTQLSSDENAVAQSVSSRTKAIIAIMDASKTELSAAQSINDGNFVDADKELERAQRTLTAQAAVVTAPAEKKRLEVAATKVATVRAAARAMPSKPKADQRAGALELNADAMHAAGF